MPKYRFCLFLLLCFWIFSAPILAQEEAPKKQKVFNGCSGGMMFHLGYLFGEKSYIPHNPQGLTYGLGGAARVNLWKHLRIGGEGYVSTMPSTATDQHGALKQGSYIRNGWGGLLIDAHWRCDKFWPYIGGTIGGGVKRSLFISDGDQNDWQAETTTTFNKQGYFLISPFVGFDYLLTQRVHLTFKVDYVLAFAKDELQTPTGPRLYFGVLFCH